MKTEQIVSLALCIMFTIILGAYAHIRLDDLEKRISEIPVYDAELTQERIQELYTLYESNVHDIVNNSNSIDSIKQITIVRERLKALSDLERRIAALEKSGMVTDTISFNDLESDTVTSEYFPFEDPKYIRIRIVNSKE